MLKEGSMYNFKKTLSTMGLVLALLMSSCGNPVSTVDNNAAITIADSEFMVEHIDATSWTSTPPAATMFTTFWVYYDEDLEVSDIKEAVIENPNGVQWTLPVDRLTVDTEYKRIKTNKLWYKDTADKVPLGLWTITIRLVNGKTASIVELVSEPGSGAFPAHLFVTASDTVPATETAMLTPASIQSAVISGDSLTIKFHETDTNVRNAFIWFFDAQDEYLGNSGFLRKDATTVNPVLEYYAQSTGDYTVTINGGSIVNTSLASLDGIASCQIVVTDGLQYGSYTHYDYRAVGEMRAFTVAP